ncbi:31-O-demethyl-FK506 methyltransferase FkbM [Aquisphaera giovannonii]|uniref:31-O-demethyl-FK506 methyltransferase FkbM n=1 Tax=Aquisphaera giovannonii TaxID=406548 RepID=A0A5B9W317_9BACT|nr:FkbM family methyltransferase [Aquisphaera giovannonii]QEH34350.1 31-O-demethyl-FK506 methyltransferase FkbM [Aquisphaera giovannonii]
MLKPLLVKLMYNRWFGIPAAVASYAAGAVPTSRKISVLCNFVPPRVRVDVPKRIADGRSFTMYGAGALDQVSRVMWWYGWDGYEKPMPDLFAALSLDSRCVLDIGSYSGFFSLIAATCSPAAHVYAFEPFPPPRAWLERNVAVNGLGGRIHIIPDAVSDQSGEATFYVPKSKTGLMETASSLNARHSPEHVDSIKVRVVTLDDFLDDQHCGPIDLMKIDVETFEDRVLRGGARSIRASRPFIFLEILTSADTGPLEAVRDDLGYVSGQLLPGGIEWQDRISASPHHYDHIFCPAEKVGRIEEVAASLGYRSTPARVGKSA